MKFIADGMLGRLARWLRILGFDVLFLPKAGDDELLLIARKECRVLFSRDTELIARAKKIPALMIESEAWVDQVRQVLDEFGLRDEVRPYSRCLRCNRSLRALPKEKIRNLVSPHVLEEGRSFALCPECGRIFWKGTHAHDMEKRIAVILGKP